MVPGKASKKQRAGAGEEEGREKKRESNVQVA